MSTLNVKADYIVRFSVLDRDLFLRDVKRILAPGRFFYPNYRNGYFRNALKLAEPSTGRPASRARLRKLTSPLVVGIWREAGYQQRVGAAVADRLVLEQGFDIERDYRHNLLSYKELAKAITDAQFGRFSRWWLGVELALNRHFSTRLESERFGNHINLSRQIMSRVLYLRHLPA